MEDQPEYRKPKKEPKQAKKDFYDAHKRKEVYYKLPKEGEPLTGGSEWELVTKYASLYSKSISQYIKDCSLEPKIKVIEKQPLINEKLFQQLHKIGVNINQIALKFNANFRENEIPEALEMLKLLANNIEEIKSKIREI